MIILEKFVSGTFAAFFIVTMVSLLHTLRIYSKPFFY